MSTVRHSSALAITLVSAALTICACTSDGTTAPVTHGVLASKSGSGGGGHGGGGGGDGGGDGGGGSGGGGGVLPPTVLTGPVYLRESFGFDPLGNGSPVRFDADGDTVSVFLGKSIDGFRAEWPNTGSEVWVTPDVSGVPSWGFAVSSAVPDEPPSPYEASGTNGVLASNNDPTDPSNNAAFLPFLQPPGAVTASITAHAGPYTTAIGFTTSAGTLTGAFEAAGAAWLVLRIPREGFNSGSAVATWELHTDGLRGPSVSGTIPLAVFPGTTTLVQNHHRIAVSYDPGTGRVVGSVDGVATPALEYSITGVTYAGFQGYGVVNNFRVEAGSIIAQ